MTETNQFYPALYTALAGVIVSTLIKLTNKAFDRRKENFDEQVILRKELREELETLRDELHKIQSELDEWREKYYHQVELTNTLKVDILRLTDELNEYKNTGTFPTIEEK